MKLKYLYIICIFFISSCTWDGIDFRDQFTGNYNGIQTCTFWQLSQPSSTTTNNVTIEVKKDSETENGIIINGDTIQINESGSYSIFQGSSYGYSVQFKNDSLFIDTHSGGLGGGTYCNTIAVK